MIQRNKYRNKEDRRGRPARQQRERQPSASYRSPHKLLQVVRPILGLVLCGISLYLFFAFFSYLLTGAEDQSLLLNRTISEVSDGEDQIANHTGVRGLYWMHLLVHQWLGLPVVFVFAILLAIGVRLLEVRWGRLYKTILFCTASAFWLSLFLTAISGLFGSWPFFNIGGEVGLIMYKGLSRQFGVVGVFLLLTVTLLLILYLTFSALQRRYMERWVHRQPREKKSKKGWQERIFESMSKHPEAVPTESTEETNTTEQEAPPLLPEETIEAPIEEEMQPAEAPDTATALDDGVDLEVIDARESEEDEETDSDGTKTPAQKAQELVAQYGEFDPRAELKGYVMPSPDLMEARTETKREMDYEEINRNKASITDTLQSFGIEIKSIIATVGPTITLYEVIPEQGVRISRIRNLEDDIALSLSALGIRIIAPIPGKGTIGIEVPNRHPQVVGMRPLLTSKRFTDSNYELPVALGRTITNEVFAFDLAKVPHLLVAGATGQGKSVGLNAIITSLLYQKHPSELKFVMIDPKVVEFSIYSSIEKHYLAKLPGEKESIITDTKRVVATLNSLCLEMDERYELLSKARVRNIKQYNEKLRSRLISRATGYRYMPYIVVIIDEYGDLIMTAGKEIELPLARLAQKARAVGIHAIIATQRPTASIITGTIKANFPGRMSFRVFSQIDSRTILDASGANRLVGKGDLLYSQGNDFIRIQCAFVDTPEINRLIDHISAQPAPLETFALPEVAADGNGFGTEGTTGAPDEVDSLFEEVARFFVYEKSASVSIIQRKFGIGYNRAGRIMDQLEARGIVGAADGSKPREVLIHSEEQLDAFLSQS